MTTPIPPWYTDSFMIVWMAALFILFLVAVVAHFFLTGKPTTGLQAQSASNLRADIKRIIVGSMQIDPNIRRLRCPAEHFIESLGGSFGVTAPCPLDVQRRKTPYQRCTTYPIKEQCWEDIDKSDQIAIEDAERTQRFLDDIDSIKGSK